MKHLFALFLLLFLGCQKQPAPLANNQTSKSDSTSKEICWKGTIKGKIPVMLHYQVDDDLLVGEITYLNTKKREPIKIIGTIADDASLRILEFEKNGNISGILTGTPSNDKFNGTWFSPKTRKELNLSLSKFDTIVKDTPILPELNKIYGNYHYQYSQEGYQGDFYINKINAKQASFEIFSVTGEPSRNIADIEKDTITLTGNKFHYKVGYEEGCEFDVTFYKDFVYINYTNGDCDGVFGHNATVEGIFLKVKK